MYWFLRSQNLCILKSHPEHKLEQRDAGNSVRVTNERQGATLCHYRTFKSSDFSEPEDLMLIIKETSYNQV